MITGPPPKFHELRNTLVGTPSSGHQDPQPHNLHDHHDSNHGHRPFGLAAIDRWVGRATSRTGVSAWPTSPAPTASRQAGRHAVTGARKRGLLAAMNAALVFLLGRLVPSGLSFPEPGSSYRAELDGRRVQAALGLEGKPYRRVGPVED